MGRKLPTSKTLKSAACLTASLMMSAVAVPSFAQDKTYTLGVVPQQSASRLAEIWVPILKAWEEKSGVSLVFSTAKDIPTFEKCLAEGAYDFAYMNPYHYTVFHDAPGYQAFAKQSEKQLKGIIVTRREGGIEALDALKDAMVAFPSPAAFGASVIPRAEMRKLGIDFTPRYVRSHDSVYRAVSAGIMPAGGGVMRTFNTVDPEIKAQLKIVYKTDGYTPHAFAAHPDVPAPKVTAVYDAMATASTASLNALGMAGIEAATNEDWDDVRALNLTDSQTEITKGDTLQCHSG